MALRPEDVYNPTPTVQPQTGSPEDYLNVRSNPNQFGGQVGGALEKTGGQAQQAGDQFVQTAIQYQGMLNESAATDLNTQAIIARGKILGDYKTQEGFQAVNSKDDTISRLAAVRQGLLANIKNPAVARAFNMLDSRQEGYSINEANDWASNQGKTAATNSAKSSVQLSIDSASTPDVALNDSRFTDNLANIKFNVSRMMSLQGYGQYMSQDPKTGTVQFDSSPQGQQASSVYTQALNESLGKAWNNKLSLEAATNPLQAQQTLDKYKDTIPAATSAEWSYKLKGAVLSADTATFAEGQLAKSEAQYYQNLNPPSGPVTKAPEWLHTATQTQESQNNPNAVSSKGAVGLMQVMPGTLANPGFGVKPANITSDMTPDQKSAELKRVGDDYLDAMYKKYNGNPLNTLVAQNWGPKNADAWIANGADFTKLPPETQIYLSKILPKGMGATGGSLNHVDFYRQNEPQILNDTFNSAMERYGDITLANQAVSHLEQKINLVKQQADDQLKVSRDQLANTITGANGGPRITSMAQLEGPGADPKLSAQWLDYKGRDWFGANALQNLVLGQNKGSSKTYGTDFYNQYQNILTGKTTNADDLGPYMKLSGSSPDSAGVTDKGYQFFSGKIKELQDPQNGPANKAFAADESKFLSTLHAEATGSNVYKDIQSPKLEQEFNQKLPNLIQTIDQMRSAGKSAGDLFNPDSKDYVGKLYQLPTPAEVHSEHFSQIMGGVGIPDTKGQGGTEELIKSLDDPSQTADAKRTLLEGAWKNNQLTATQADRLGRVYKLYNYAPKQAAPQVPLPSNQ